jgi:hypothetical protein
LLVVDPDGSVRYAAGHVIESSTTDFDGLCRTPSSPGRSDGCRQNFRLAGQHFPALAGAAPGWE